MNENEKNVYVKLNEKNYNITVKKLHAHGWENSSFTSTDGAVLGHGCGVSQYQQLENYQLLPRPYLGIFEGSNWEKPTKEKWMLDLAG